MSKIREFKEPKLYVKEKLEEAHYFLLQMRRNYVDRKEFIFNMNAFLNSTRSVRWVLEKEFAHSLPLRAWYSQKESEMDKDEFMKFFEDLRNVSTHEGTPEHKVSLKWAYAIPVNEKLDAFGYSERKVSGDEKDMGSILFVPTYDKNGMLPCLVDVIRKSYFSEFLRMIERDYSILTELIIMGGGGL